MKFVILKIIIFLKVESILSTESYREQFSTECGQPKTTGRIVGGTDANLGEFPWMARIGLRLFKFMRPSFFCGGSLITDRHILSAAHCFYRIVQKRQDRLLIVSLGDHKENGKLTCVGTLCSDQPVIYDVERLEMRNTDETSYEDDIAVLTLQTDVIFTRWISPVCLPDNISPTTMVGQNVITMGFGLVDSRKRHISSILQKITIAIRPLGDCFIFSQPLELGQICAGHPERDSCDGDSGGPLIKLITGDDGPRYIQLGVVSYGAEVCENDKPAVYTDVNFFMDWIDEQINNSISN